MLRLSLLIILICSLKSFATKDSSSTIKRQFGVEVTVTSGFGYTYALGSSIFVNNRHSFALGGTILLPENPFKEKWSWGLYADYNFHLFKRRQYKISPYINTSIHYFHLQNSFTVNSSPGSYNTYSYTYITTSDNVFNIVGIGASTKLINKLYFKSSVNIMTIGHHRSVFEQQNLITESTYIDIEKINYYNTFSFFSIDDLTLKCTLTYFFN